jgi:hypothetical protein
METLKATFDGRAFVPEKPVRLPKNHTVYITILNEAPVTPRKPKAVRVKPVQAAPVASIQEEAPHKPKCIYGGHLTPEEKKARYDDEVALINAHADELNAFMEGVLEDQADVFEELDTYFAKGGSFAKEIP